MCVDRYRLLALRGYGSFHQNGDRSSNFTRAPAENSKNDYLDDLELYLARRLGLSVNEEGKGTVTRM